MYLKNIIGKYYSDNKKFVFMDENLKVDENYKEEIKEEDDMMEVDEDEDIDNGEEENEAEDINSQIDYIEEGELPNEEVVKISDDSESERDIDVESMMMKDVEDESNDEQSNIANVDKDKIYSIQYNKLIEKTVFLYKDEIMAILNNNSNDEH